MCLAMLIGVSGCVTDEPATQAAAPPPQQPLPIVPVSDTREGVPPLASVTMQENANVQYYPSDEPLRMGIENFTRGYYGKAERYFRDAVERAPKDASAWIGLAASYDRLGRYDLADRAYRSAVRLSGETTALLNNRGFSYMLRGNFHAARRDFLKAYDREPHNPIIANNLKLLDGSERAVKRSPGAIPVDWQRPKVNVD
jgi:Flp pilus assembly protein TadD